MNLFELMATLTLDSSEYVSGIREAMKQAEPFANAARNGIGKAMDVAKVAIGATTAATIALTGAMAAGISSTASYGDEIDKASQKLGISAQAYQEWDAVMRHSGTSMSSMSSTFKTLQNAVAQTTDAQSQAFEKLGLSVDSLRNMSTEEAFGQVINSLQQMEEGAERTALANDLLGRGSMELGALLNTSAEDTQKMIEAVNELGGVMSDDAVKASATFKDSLQDLQTIFVGAKNAMMSEFLPSVNTVMGGLIKIFSGDSSGIGEVKNGIKEFGDTFREMIPRIKEVAKEILPLIGETLIEGLPLLFEMGTELLAELINGIVEGLPAIISSAADIITTIADALVTNMPTLVSTLIANLPAIFMALLNACIALVGSFIQVGGTIVTMIGNGLTNAQNKLKEAGARLFETFKSAISAKLASIRQVGGNLVQGLWNGISDKVGWIVGQIRSFGSSVMNAIKGIFGVHSPSTEMKWVGQMLVEGFNIGLSELTDQRALSNKIQSAIDGVTYGDYTFGKNGSGLVTVSASSAVNDVVSLLQTYLPRQNQVYVDGKKVSAAVSPYTMTDIEKLNRFNNRLVGVY